MASSKMITIDGNEAAASVAYRLNEVIAIYPITPSSTMGELADEWSAARKPNIWGTIPQVIEMQSEGGAAGAVHGALQAGSLSTTFTASQGLLLMLPNMFKIAGELTPFCMHVAARALATHALSIFGDHSDVMSCRQTGFAMLCSNSVQEAHDFACIAHAATLRARVPFIHFFDGFRTSHEVSKIEPLSDAQLLEMMDEACIAAHRNRALTPDHPVLRGSAQNPDTYFQAREACNGYYSDCPVIVQAAMDRFAGLTGRAYKLFDYHGHPQAERVIIVMGSGAEAVHETVDWLSARGEKVGVLKVRLFRPFSILNFIAAIPQSVRSIAVLDRTKEPGGVGEPMYQDVVTALQEAAASGLSKFAALPAVIGGRYGLASKEFDPAMARAVFHELTVAKPKNHFTVGITDDVTHTSLAVDPDFEIEPADVVRAVFFGLGSDGTVGANKNSIKIIGEETENFAQGYFVYDSKKSGAITVSHLRFGPRQIRSSYLVKKASFVACHQFNLLERNDVLSYAADGAVFLLNSPFGTTETWDHLPREVQEQIIAKHIKLYVIDALKVAKKAGMGGRINTVMQVCFFSISGVLPKDQAIAQIKKSIQKTYAKKGEEVVRRNFEAVDASVANLFEVATPTRVTASPSPPLIPDEAPDFVKRVTALIMANKGNLMPVSAFPVDGTWPLSTSRWERRNIAVEIPHWDSDICVQCNKCAMVCPHAAIRAKVYPPASLAGAPAAFQSTDYRAPEFENYKYTIQVAPEDCTGCSLCVMVCPAKDRTNPRHKAIDMLPQAQLRETETENFKFFRSLPEVDRTAIKQDVKNVQLLEPLFEFSGACAGCGETPYIKLLTQLYGDRMLIANATGCSSIYGGNLPTTPYSTNLAGRGPAWANSLFEDNAEFGFGIRVAVDKHVEYVTELLKTLSGTVGDELTKAIIDCPQNTEAEIIAQRDRVAILRSKVAAVNTPEAQRLMLMADYLVRKSVWIVGGDGWAYDIGYGGLDHVLAQTRRIKVLVLDTEVYSNTGGQQSKSTPLGASAKFAIAGKTTPKKDLGLIAMSYGHIYVARIAFGARDAQTLRAIEEAESYPGPALIIAYSHCIAHGYDLAQGLEQQKLAVNSGYWPLYRYDPRLAAEGKPAMQLDCSAPKESLGKFMRNEARFRLVEQQNAQQFKTNLAAAQKDAATRFALYGNLAADHKS